MSALQVVLAVASGGVVGFALGLIGGGGSILAVPLMLYVVGLRNPHVVIGSSALAVAVNAFFNLFPHWRAGHVRWGTAVEFALPGAAGAVLGSEIGKAVNGQALLFFFALLMLVIAATMLRRPQPSRIPERAHPERVVPTGFLTGALSGFFGIGGGFLIVPGLMFSAGLPMIWAVGTSLVSVGTFGLATAVNYALAGLVNWGAVGAYLVGGAGGGWAGSRLASRLGAQRGTLTEVFAATIVVVALYMLYLNGKALHLIPPGTV
ncbi:MAG: sulfite exporter TauE/SafE family protein [Firmicutes bacterium]|nr:sulfite exporter TauE/SafE family protein [Alicyclobacillaceae bacterium]MCL6496087.1 sulfite exporter TauE/SafE family protein [Bacillota bacterium]